MRKNHTKQSDPWYHSALHEVWLDMMRHARFLYDDRRGLPVDETFRTFEGFVLWATVSQGYRKRNKRGMYRNVRMHVRDMIPLLEEMNGNVVVTLVARACYLPEVDAEADHPPIPEDERIDVERKR